MLEFHLERVVNDGSSLLPSNLNRSHRIYATHGRISSLKKEYDVHRSPQAFIRSRSNFRPIPIQ